MYGGIPRSAYPGRDGGRFANTENRETGRRTKVTALIVRHPEKPTVEEVLRRELTEEFGGFTMIPCFGGWKDPATGKIEFTKNMMYEVSFKDPSRVQKVISLFSDAARELGEEWLHIEVTDFQADHRKVN